MSLDLALNAARSGLAATQRALAQASQNIANASTPGYTRKTLPPEAVVFGDMPLGVRSGSAQRDVDAALLARIEASRSAEAGAALRESLLRSVEDTQPVSGAGALPDTISAMRDSFIALRASPADAGLQRDALAAAQDVAKGLNTLSGAIGTARQGAQDAIVQEVGTINATLREIAGLTARLKAGLDAPDAAALEDQRDAALARLSESLEVRAVRQPGGDLLLLTRGGTMLPLDPDRDLLSTAGATVQPGAYYGGSGTLPGITLLGLDITRQVTGGRLGAAIELRDRTLPRMQAEADVTAAFMAGRMEAQGLRLYLDTGGASPPTRNVPYAGSGMIGYAGRIYVNPAIVANPALLRDGTQAVAPGSGPTAFTPNPAGGPAGFTTLIDRILDFTFGDSAAPGSLWQNLPTSGLGPDGTLVSSSAPTRIFSEYATRVMAGQATDRAAATAAKQDATDLRTTLQERFGRQSGVDVDAELAAMVALQNAYAANARVLGTVQSMWDQLLASVR